MILSTHLPGRKRAPGSRRSLDQRCLATIARYKRPREYRFVPDLPTSNYGKVLKRELRDQLLAEPNVDRSLA